MEKKTILLVEDDFLNRRLSKKILLENGYGILEAKNANEALEVLNREKPDLAILDINLGKEEQNGISLGQQMQDRHALPFIYLTAYENADIINKAIATNPYSYITKPFKDTDLIASVEIAIRQSAKDNKHLPTVLVKDGEYTLKLSIKEIDYIESDGNYLLFHAGEKVYRNRCTIRQIIDILPRKTFVQTHRAYVVNTTKIDKFNVKMVAVRNNIIPVSRNYINDISVIVDK